MKPRIPVLLLAASLTLGWTVREARAAGSLLDDPKAAVTAAFERLSKEYPKGKTVHVTRVEITPKRVELKAQNARNEEEIVSLSYEADGRLVPLPGTQETMAEIIQMQSFSHQDVDWAALVPFMQEAVRQSKIPSGTVLSLSAWKDWQKGDAIVIHATIGGQAGESGFARADAKGKLVTVDSTVLQK